MSLANLDKAFLLRNSFGISTLSSIGAVMLCVFLFCSATAGPEFYKLFFELCRISYFPIFLFLCVILIAYFMFYYDRLPLFSQKNHALALIVSLMPVGPLIWGAFWWTSNPHGLGHCWQSNVLAGNFFTYLVLSLLMILLYKEQRLFFFLWFLNGAWFCFVSSFSAFMAITGTWL